MGFKARARKHRQESGEETEQSTSAQKEGEIPCGVSSCDDFADKHFGGRSLSVDNATEMWGEGSFDERKGRVRVCKSCYRKWKKESKEDDMY
ncbi:MAG: hypothetical protein VW230_06520 [Candidatus Poseidoniales archaeon]